MMSQVLSKASDNQAVNKPLTNKNDIIKIFSNPTEINIDKGIQYLKNLKRSNSISPLKRKASNVNMEKGLQTNQTINPDHLNTNHNTSIKLDSKSRFARRNPIFGAESTFNRVFGKKITKVSVVNTDILPLQEKMIIAAKTNDVHSISTMLEGYPRSVWDELRDKQGRNLLEIAIEHGYLDLVKFLITNYGSEFKELASSYLKDGDT